MKTSRVIWVLEDDPSAQFVYKEILAFRYDLHIFESMAAFRQAISNANIPRADLMIIDLHLPDDSFLSFLQTQAGQESTKNIPFMVVSSIDDLDALRNCYEGGANEYISKPFAKSELIVKIERILAKPRLANGSSGHQEVFLDPTTFTVERSGVRSEILTAKEYKILAILLNAKDHRATRQEIQDLVWPETDISAKSMDQHFFHLRKKINATGIEISFSSPYYRLFA